MTFASIGRHLVFEEHIIWNSRELSRRFAGWRGPKAGDHILAGRSRYWILELVDMETVGGGRGGGELGRGSNLQFK